MKTAECTVDCVGGKDLEIFGLGNDEKETCKTEENVKKEVKVESLNGKRTVLYRKIARIALVSRVVAAFKACGIVYCAWNWPCYGVVAVVELLGFCSNRNFIKKLIYMFMFSLTIAATFRVYLLSVLSSLKTEATTHNQIALILLILSTGLDCVHLTLSLIICYHLSKYTKSAVNQIVEYSNKTFKYF